MNEKQKDELLKHVVGAIGAIKAQFEVEVIKDYEIPPLVNMRTGATTGFGVELQLNTKYDYDEATLNDWKDKLQADEWHLRVRRSQLWVTFKVRNFVPTEKHIAKMSHAIGLDNKQPKNGCYEAYRNGSFYDEPDELWDDLVVAGYAYDRRKEKDYRYFVTPKGFQLLADHHKLMIRFTNEYEGEK